MLLCLHSKRSRASLQLLRRWPRVQGEVEQRGHFGSTIFFHFARLSGLARQLVHLAPSFFEKVQIGRSGGPEFWVIRKVRDPQDLIFKTPNRGPESPLPSHSEFSMCRNTWITKDVPASSESSYSPNEQELKLRQENLEWSTSLFPSKTNFF